MVYSQSETVCKPVVLAAGLLQSLRGTAATKERSMTEQLSKTKPKTVEITIDEQPYSVEAKELTVREILAQAGKDADHYYLVEVKGKKERTRYDDPDAGVKIRKGSKFVTVFRGETPVS
jgi:hypothetical protein